MKHNLRRILWCAALAGLPFMQVLAVTDWVPVGTAVDANGFATTGGVYSSQDYLGENSPHAHDAFPYNTSFTSASGGTNGTLNVFGTLYNKAPDNGGTQAAGPIACSLKVNGNVILDATNADMTVNIKEAVVIEPYFDAPVGGLSAADCHQIYFQTGDNVNRVMNINVNNNLEFRGKTTGGGFADLLLTFAGRGRVNFNMVDGTSVSFNGTIDETGGQTLDPVTGEFVPACPTITNNAGGTKVFILMDQTLGDFQLQRNKVVFQRQTLGLATNTERVLINVGPNSLITYLSTNPTGLPVTPGNINERGWGSIAFDISNGNVSPEANEGNGRMVLNIDGAFKRDLRQFIGGGHGEEAHPNPDFNKVIARYPLNDGAVEVRGSFVPAFTAETISGCATGTEGEILVPAYDFSQPAGIKATMRIIDNLTLAQNSSLVLNPSSTTAKADARRGLLVLNQCYNHGTLASDPYWFLFTDAAAGFISVDFAASNPANARNMTRRGFVLGVNGQLDIYDNTFIDHASASLNTCDILAVCDFVDTSLIKPRNSSAVIVDGLDPSLFIDGNPLNGNAFSLFEAADPFTQATPVRGQVLCRGSGTLYLKEVASTYWGYAYNLIVNNGPDALANINLDWTLSLETGSGTYNGVQLDPATNPLQGGKQNIQQSGEGQHVLDVEGEWQVDSAANTTEIDPTTLVARAYNAAAVVPMGNGLLNMSSILRDYTGREVGQSGDDDLINGGAGRPLYADGTIYYRYNSPAMFFNNFAMLNNVHLRHSDATKFVNNIPAADTSEPAMTGGERLWFAISPAWGDTAANHQSDPNRYRFPEVQLFNSTLEIQENLNCSGFRWVVKDIPGVQTTAGNNTATVQFFDHGDPLDTAITGYGRIFLNGSLQNLMCDGSSNAVTETSVWNIFKHNQAPAGSTVANSVANSAAVKLSITNGNQFLPIVLNVINSMALIGQPAGTFNPAQLAFISKQRAQHLFLVAQPDSDDALCNIEIGWPAINDLTAVPAGMYSIGDAGVFPGNFPYPATPLFLSATQPVREPIVPSGVSTYTQVPFSLTSILQPDTGQTAYSGQGLGVANPLPIPAATISIDGSIICFGSFDKNGNSIAVPVGTDNDNGVVYVKHGGNITITRPTPTPAGPIPGVGETDSIPYWCVFATTLAQRLWNDYNFDGTFRLIQLTGNVDLPRDQVKYEDGCDVQVYNITHAMFNSRRTGAADSTDGYVRVSFQNPNRFPVFDQTGGEEVTFGWFYRETPDLGITPSTVVIPDYPPLAGDIAPKSLQTKMTKAADIKRRLLTRATESITAPVPRPTDLLYVGSGDDITQLHVAGATFADHLYWM